MNVDLAIAGGGPAGLAVAIEAASRGISTVVVERREGTLDKACGEGLMPPGVAWLERHGVRALLSDDDASPFRGIRYVQEDGTAVEGALRAPGLGIRRTALVAALRTRARALGVELWDGTSVSGARFAPDRATLQTTRGEVSAGLLVAADGLHSPLRRALGLEGEVSAPRRFGIRRHFARGSWSDCVEVHLSAGAEAYVTPVGRSRVEVAFLWEQGAEEKASYEALLARFPRVAAHLEGAAFDSPVLGAGPFVQRATRVIAPRLALVGDAAGYVDAITGEGVSLAFSGAEVLGAALPAVLASRGSMEALEGYARWHRRAFGRYARVTGGLLALARRPRLRRAAISLLARRPALFERALAVALG